VIIVHSASRPWWHRDQCRRRNRAGFWPNCSVSSERRGSGQIDRFVSSRDGHEAFGLAPIDVPVLLVDDKYMASHGRNHDSMMMTFVTETLQKKAKTGCPVHRPTLELNRA
jgi:hypothetical protein